MICIHFLLILIVTFDIVTFLNIDIFPINITKISILKINRIVLNLKHKLKKTLTLKETKVSLPLLSLVYPDRKGGGQLRQARVLPDFFSRPRKQSRAILHMQTRPLNVV